MERPFCFSEAKKSDTTKESMGAGLRPAVSKEDYGDMFQRHRTQHEAMMLITSNTRKRIPSFKDPARAREAIETLYRVQKLYPFHLFGFVIMPDHCHFLVVVPYPGKISDIMRTFKMGLTFQIGKGPLWQTRFHIELVKNSRAALKYIHQNPVKEGLVKDERDFPWSSAAGNWPIYPLGYS